MPASIKSTEKFVKKIANPLDDEWWKPEATSRPVKLTSKSVTKLIREARIEAEEESKGEPLTKEEVKQIVKEMKKDGVF